MKVVRVICHVEFKCIRCDTVATGMGLATVTDGKIDEGEAIGETICNECKNRDIASENREYYAQRNRKAWAKKNEGKVK